jgi:hypothetical protein
MSNYLGMFPEPPRWSANVKIGNTNTIPVEFDLDPSLPPLGQYGSPPDSVHYNVVIPRGRIVAAKATTLTRTENTTLVTLANGVSPLEAPAFATGNFPMGYALFNIYRNYFAQPAHKPGLALHETIEVPYTAVNENYNNSGNGGSRLVVGEAIMAYYGSATSQTAIPQDRGKIVRFVPRKVFADTHTASGQFTLTNAPFPAFKPRILYALGINGLVVTSGATLVYNNTWSTWIAEYTGISVQTVVYEYGADPRQRIGQIVGIEPVGTAGGINASSHDMMGWFKWVTDDFGAWEWPPIMSVRPTTSVTDENVTIDSNNEGNIANFPIVPFKPITVAVTGSYVKADGTSVTLAGALDLADNVFWNDYSQGALYDIDFLNGKLRFSSNVSVTSCKVSYFYEQDFRNGLTYDRGMFGLTDGRDSGIMGLPPHLDIAGVRGAMRVMIF